MAKHEPIISVSGFRGILGESLDPISAMKFAIAFANETSDGPILLSRDGRSSGLMLSDAVSSALNAIGRDVFDADVAATPTTGVLVRSMKCAGGIQISASHNPAEYNGMKLFGTDGRVLSGPIGAKVIEEFSELDLPSAWTSFENIGTRAICEDTISEHLQLVLSTIDVNAIRERKFKVVLDSNHGAGSVIGEHLLAHLDCEFEILGSSPDGQFEHPPEPTESNLQTTAQKIKSMNAHVGFCQDPDGDRLAIIDEKGTYIGEEYTLAITLDHALEQNPGPVVINCATSRMSIDLANKYGAEIFQSAVGEANVCDMMIQKKAIYGGEGNGGPIDPRVGYVRDSFVAMSQILDVMAKRDQQISELVSEIPTYGIHKVAIRIERSKIPTAFEKLQRHFSDAKVNTLDGLRLDWDDRWLLVRASNTEPIVRIICEAPDLISAQAICDQSKEIVESSI